jgi:Metal-dependent proteases with possible chaperone activity
MLRQDREAFGPRLSRRTGDRADRKDGDTQRFALPRPMWRKRGCDFSFSGLKTAVRQTVEKLPAGDKQAVADLCASFQRTVGDVLADRCANALELAPMSTLVVAGGVAANGYLRSRLDRWRASTARGWWHHP